MSSTEGPATGINYGIVNYLVGDFRNLHRQVVDLSGLPAELGLEDPSDPNQPVGMFTGRAELIDRIDRFIDRRLRGGPGYLLIEAEAGMGKSALTTYLAFTRDWPTHVTHVAGDPSPAAARANLGAQVIARWGLKDAAPNGLLPPEHKSPNWFSQVLTDASHAAAGPAEHNVGPRAAVVLLIDGLDEAPAASPGGMPLGLPRVLPKGVVVIMTSRAGTAVPAGIPVERIEVESPANIADLRNYLDARIRRDPALTAALETSTFQPKQLSAALAYRSGGIWIYALTVLDQICDGTRSPDDVDTLPRGLAANYADNLVRWRGDPTLKVDEGVMPLLGALAAAREARTAASLARWAGITVTGARALLRGLLRAFLVTRPGGDPDCYALRHESLREFCQGKVPPDAPDQVRHVAYDLTENTTAAQHRVVDCLTPAARDGIRSWDAAMPDADYTRLHLPHHAAECGRLDELVDDPGFLLFVSRPELLRLRRMTSTGRAAIAALEVAANAWSDTRTDRLAWLELSARKTGASTLANAIAVRHRQPWRPIAAVWHGTSHTTLTGHASSVQSMVVVPTSDGRILLATASRTEVRIWDPAALVPIGTSATSHREPIRTMVAVPMPDGRTLLATASNTEVRLWEPETLSPAGDIATGHSAPMRAMVTVPLPDGGTLLATAGDDRTVRLWDPSSRTAVGAPLTGHTSAIAVMVAIPLPDRRVLLATAGNDCTVRLWDVLARRPVGAPLTGHSGLIWAMVPVPMPDDRKLLATAGYDQCVRLWDPATASAFGTPLSGHSDSIRALVALPTSRERTLLAAASNTELRSWNAATQAPVTASPTGHDNTVRAIATIPVSDGPSLLATASNTEVRLWNVETLAPAGKPLIGHTDPICAMVTVPMPDGRMMLATAGYDHTTRLWEPEAIAQADSVQVHTYASDTIEHMAAIRTAAGRVVLATVGDDRTVRLWDPPTLAPVGRPAAMPTGAIVTIATIPAVGGRTLLATADETGTVQLWDTQTMRPTDRIQTGHPIRSTRSFEGPARAIWAMTTVPMPGGRTLLATSGSGQIRLWDPERLSPAGELVVNPGFPLQTMVGVRSSTGRSLLAASDSETIRLWDVEKLAPAGQLVTSSYSWGMSTNLVPMTTLSTSKGGRMLLAATGPGKIRLWDLESLASCGMMLTGTDSPIWRLITIPTPDGGSCLAAAGREEIWLFNPATLELLGSIVTGQTDPIRATVAVPLLDGRHLLAIGSVNRTIIVWERP